MIWEWPREWYRFTSAKCYLRSRSQSSRSSWTGRRNVYGPHAQFWVIEVSIKDIEAPESYAVEAFIERLGGIAGLLRMGSPMQLTPQYNGDAARVITAWSDGKLFTDGTGWVGGLLLPAVIVRQAAPIGATSVVIGGGLPVSTPRVIRRGDLVEFRRGGVWDDVPSMHRVTSDAATNADGDTGIQFVPPLRKGVAAADAVVLDHPRSVFRMSDEEQGVAGYEPPVRASLGFTLIENVL